MRSSERRRRASYPIAFRHFPRAISDRAKSNLSRNKTSAARINHHKGTLVTSAGSLSENLITYDQRCSDSFIIQQTTTHSLTIRSCRLIGEPFRGVVIKLPPPFSASILPASPWQSRPVNTTAASEDIYKALEQKYQIDKSIGDRKTMSHTTMGIPSGGGFFLASSAMVGILALLWNAGVREACTVLPDTNPGSPCWFLCEVITRAAVASALLFLASAQLYRHCLCIKPSRELRKSAFTDARQRAATYPPPYPVISSPHPPPFLHDSPIAVSTYSRNLSHKPCNPNHSKFLK